MVDSIDSSLGETSVEPGPVLYFISTYQGNVYGPKEREASSLLSPQVDINR